MKAASIVALARDTDVISDTKGRLLAAAAEAVIRSDPPTDDDKG
jgi:hypothetical protein